MKVGDPTFQQSWDRFLDRAADVGRSVSTGFQQWVDSVEEEIETRWQDAVEWVSGSDQPSAAPVVPLLEGLEDDPKITANSRVLIIGDSQTVGPYGQSLDEMARATGATVVTHASWGSSPHWFFSGQPTNYKYWSRDAEGNSQTTMGAETPLLNDLLAEHRPDVVIVTMGGNMIASNASQASVTQQVSQIGNAVSASGAELVWVGPPKYDPERRSPELVESFYAKLRNVVPEFGALIDSRAYIEAYSGNDGLHYTGRRGERIAGEWAAGVFQEIQELD